MTKASPLDDVALWCMFPKRTDVVAEGATLADVSSSLLEEGGDGGALADEGPAGRGGSGGGSGSHGSHTGGSVLLLAAPRRAEDSRSSASATRPAPPRANDSRSSASATRRASSWACAVPARANRLEEGPLRTGTIARCSSSGGDGVTERAAPRAAIAFRSFSNHSSGTTP